MKGIKIDRIVVLAVLSIIFILSIFVNSKLVFISATSLWLISIVYNIHIMMKHAKMNVFDIENELRKRSEDYSSKKKYGQAIVNYMAYPAMVVAIGFVIVDIIVYWVTALR